MSGELTTGRLAVLAKVALAGRTVWLYALVRARLRRSAIPQVVEGLTRVPQLREQSLRSARLGRMVGRVLAIGPWRARCLHTSLVLYRLMREQGEDAQIVIGLPNSPRDKDAHAWVELGGVDVGPPPGRGSHVELARYPA